MSCKPCTNRSSIERMSFENRPMRTSWKSAPVNRSLAKDHVDSTGDPRSPVLFASGVTGRGPGSRLGPYNLRANGSNGKQTLDLNLCSWGADARRAPMSHPSVGKVLNTSALGPTPYFFTGVRLRRFL